MKINATLAFLLMTPMLQAVEWSIEQCSSLDLLAGRTGVADVRPSNDPHHNSDQMVEQNSGIYRGQWSWQSEMPELLYGMMNSGDAAKVSPSGFTALQAACVYADENIFRALMEAGVPIDTRPGDWQQLGYVGDTPLGLLIRFMNSRTAAARLRMARVLLEKGANPDAPMTTWKGNRVVITVPFCEMGSQECNHEMRMLLLQFGEQDLKKRTASWSLDWDAYRPELVQMLRRGGISKKASMAQQATRKRVVGKVPLLDLIRKGDVEGVRQALDSGVSIEVSPRARRYGQEPLFNIPVRYKDSPENAIEIARMLIDAGADINALNRRGKSLRIHYDRYRSKAARELCAYLKDRGSLIHPDSPENVEKLAEAHKERDENIRRRQEALLKAEETAQPVEEPAPAPQSEQLAAEPAPAPQPEQSAAEPAPGPQPEQPAAEPAPAPQPEQPAAEPVPEPQPEQPAAEPAPEPQPEQPAAEPAPAPQPEQPAAEPAPAPQPEQPAAEPAPALQLEQPAAEPAPEPQPEQPAAEPAPEPQPEQPAAEPAPEPQPEQSVPAAMDPSQKLMLEVQAQLAELQAKYEAEQKAREEAEQKQTAEGATMQEPY